MNRLRSEDRVLIIGTGSGRDIASALLVRELFQKELPKVDLAGFLTPWSLHRFGGKPEAVVNLLKTQKIDKYLASNPPVKLGVSFESYLPAMFNKCGVSVENTYLFSLQYGSTALANSILKLVSDRKYSLILAVDVGGDILGGKSDRRTVITPIVDTVCLLALSKVPVPVYLGVLSPGSCGEIPLARLNAMCSARGSRMQPDEKVIFNPSGTAFKSYAKINTGIDNATGIPSGSFRTIREIAGIKSARPVKCKYTIKYSIGSKSWNINFQVMISPEYMRTLWLYDFKKLWKNSGSVTTEFPDVLSSFFHYRNAGFCGTELDMKYAKVPGNDNESVFLLTPSCRAGKRARYEMIIAGIREVVSGRISAAIVMQEDLCKLPVSLQGLAIRLSKRFVLFKSGSFNVKSISKLKSMLTRSVASSAKKGGPAREFSH